MLVILLYFCFSNDFYLQCVDSPSLPSLLCAKIAFSPPSGIILYGREWEFNAALPQKLANSRKTGKGGQRESLSFCISVKRAVDSLSFSVLES